MKIITAVVNNPIFIEIQYYTFKKFVKGEYEFIVFNDAKPFPDGTNGNDTTIRQKIEEICSKLNITCINVPNDHHNRLHMSERHADTFNKHVLTYQKQNPDKYLLVDSDMFLIDYFDIERYAPYACAASFNVANSQSYLWPGICYFDMTQITNFELINWSCCPGFDTGGMTKEWLKSQLGDDTSPQKLQEIRAKNNSIHLNHIYTIQHLCSCSWNISQLPDNLKDNTKLIEFLNNDVRNTNDTYFCEIYDNIFLHYRAGSNWMDEGLGVHNMLSNKLKDALL